MKRKLKKDRKRFGVRYPWEVWFRRSHFVLRRGVDYECRTAAMAQITWRAAKRHGVEVSIETAEDEDSLVVTVHTPVSLVKTGKQSTLFG